MVVGVSLMPARLPESSQQNNTGTVAAGRIFSTWGQDFSVDGQQIGNPVFQTKAPVIPFTLTAANGGGRCESLHAAQVELRLLGDVVRDTFNWPDVADSYLN
jgi:hypothetical protein